MKDRIVRIDNTLIRVFRAWSQPFARFSLFVVYVWFGILKIFDVSPANPLVLELQKETLPFLSFNQFIVIFSIFEIAIGVLFLFPKTLRLVLPLFAIHMVMTLLPLILLPELAWQKPFVPTLEGQYMIKNLVLIALAIGLVYNLKPFQAASSPSQKI